MLVLSRKKEQSIVITATNGERITVCVLGIDIGRVRLGTDAPDGVTVHRNEVQEVIDREKQTEGES